MSDVDDRIAIGGLACRVPGAADAAALWRNLTAGVGAIRRFTAAEPARARAEACKWLRGGDVVAGPGRRVPLPGYPFQRCRHWGEPPGLVRPGGGTVGLGLPTPTGAGS